MTSSLEPITGAISKDQPSDYRSESEYHPDDPLRLNPGDSPPLNRLFKRIHWLFWLNTGLLIVMFSQAYFAYRSNELSRAALTETRTSNAALLSLTREAMMTERRAWVTVTGASLTPVPEASEFARVRIEFENAGPSPALDVSGLINVAVSANIPAMQVGTNPASGSVLSRDSKGTSYARSTDRIPRDLLARVLRNEVRIYVVGRITYRDIFNQRRETLYCFVSRGDGQRLNANLDYCEDGTRAQ